MNILIVNYEYPPLGGGGGVATKELAEELAKKHTVHVLTTCYKDLPTHEVTSGVVIHRVRVLRRTHKATATILSMVTFIPTALVAGMRICQKYKFDVINAHFVIPSGLPAVLLSKWFSIPFVLSFIGGDLYDPSKGISPHRHGILRALIRYISKAASVRTAISKDTKERAQRLHAVTDDIAVIPIGLVPQTHPTASREELGLPEEGLVAVSIGRLIPRKGFDTLIKAWESIPDMSLVIVGNGPWHDRLQKQIDKAGLSNRVQLMGRISEERKWQVLRASDLYISAAQHEGFGIVFLEAMDAGLPIIAPREGGQNDFLEHEKHALLVDSTRTHEIAKAVNTLRLDQQLRSTMSNVNTLEIKKYYIQETAALFEKQLRNAVDL